MNYQAENLYVHFPPGITINILLQNTRNEMGDSFLTYSARDNNCQNFILLLLQANILSNERNILFTKQSTTGLFSITQIEHKYNENRTQIQLLTLLEE